MGYEKVYCRYEEEKSQRHLEGLNMAMRGSRSAEQERKQRGNKEGTWDPLENKRPRRLRRHRGKSSWGKGMETGGLEMVIVRVDTCQLG